MPFNKGQSGNLAGRPRATQEPKETYAVQLENMISKHLVENFSMVQNIETTEDLKKARIYCDLLRYIIPRAVPMRVKETKLEDLSTPQLAEIVENLRAKSISDVSFANSPEYRDVKDEKEFLEKVLSRDND